MRKYGEPRFWSGKIGVAIAPMIKDNSLRKTVKEKKTKKKLIDDLASSLREFFFFLFTYIYFLSYFFSYLTFRFLFY